MCGGEVVGKGRGGVHLPHLNQGSCRTTALPPGHAETETTVADAQDRARRSLGHRGQRAAATVGRVVGRVGRVGRVGDRF